MDPLNARFRDRIDGGRMLARKLIQYSNRKDVIVLGLPRGGVVTASEVAKTLGAPLDVLVIRKLGVPGHEELAMGAVGPSGVRFINDEVVRELAIVPREIDRVATTETKEQRRRELLFRGDAAPLDLTNRTAIIVDDGLATGSTILAAIRAARALHAKKVVVAVPVAATSSLPRVEREADEVICVMTGEPFVAVSMWYQEFPQTSDDEVTAILANAERAAVKPASIW